MTSLLEKIINDAKMVPQTLGYKILLELNKEYFENRFEFNSIKVEGVKINVELTDGVKNHYDFLI